MQRTIAKLGVSIPFTWGFHNHGGEGMQQKLTAMNVYTILLFNNGERAKNSVLTVHATPYICVDIILDTPGEKHK